MFEVKQSRFSPKKILKKRFDVVTCNLSSKVYDLTVSITLNFSLTFKRTKSYCVLFVLCCYIKLLTYAALFLAMSVYFCAAALLM